MTLQASGSMTIAQIEAEFGLPAGSLFPNAFYGLGGAPASGTLSIPNDFYGRSNVPPYPAAPTYVGSSTVQSGGSTLSVAWPSHQTNDVGILIVQTNNQVMPSAPTGCTAIYNGIGAGTAGAVGAVRGYAYWIRASSGAMPAISVPDSGNVTGAALAVFRGCRVSGNPYDSFTNTRQATATTAVSLNATTYLYGVNRMIFSGLAHARDSAVQTLSSWANSNTTGMTEAFDNGGITSNGGGVAAAYGVSNGQTTTGSTTATLATSVVYEGVTIALVPEGIPASGITPETGTTLAAQDNGTSGGGNGAKYTLTSGSGPVTWNWTVLSGATGFVSNVSNGGSASSITFDLAQGAADRSSLVQVTVGNYTWLISLYSTGYNTGVSVVAVGVGGVSVSNPEP